MSELSVGQLKGLTVNNNVMTVPSGHTLYAPGHVIQVVNFEYVGSEISSSSTTYVETNVTATITPKYTTSKILVVAKGNWLKNATNASNGVNVRLLRDGSVVKTITGLGVTNTAIENNGSYSITYFDSPSTTSPVTYKTQFANSISSVVVIHGRGHNGTLTLMEIAQ